MTEMREKIARAIANTQWDRACSALGTPNYPRGNDWTRFLPEADAILALIEPLIKDNEELKHDIERQMTIANIECNEAERLREALEAIDKTAFIAVSTDSDETAHVAVESIHDIASATLSPKSEKQDD
jgi:hypothetical protein